MFIQLVSHIFKSDNVIYSQNVIAMYHLLVFELESEF